MIYQYCRSTENIQSSSGECQIWLYHSNFTNCSLSHYTDGQKYTVSALDKWLQVNVKVSSGVGGRNMLCKTIRRMILIYIFMFYFCYKVQMLFHSILNRGIKSLHATAIQIYRRFLSNKNRHFRFSSTERKRSDVTFITLQVIHVYWLIPDILDS